MKLKGTIKQRYAVQSIVTRRQINAIASRIASPMMIERVRLFAETTAHMDSRTESAADMYRNTLYSWAMFTHDTETLKAMCSMVVLTARAYAKKA